MPAELLPGGRVRVPDRPPLPPDLRHLNVRDLLAEAVAAQPDRPVVVTRSSEMSYRELDDLSSRAAALWQSMGVGKGDRVAIIVGNQPEFLVVWFGLMKIGAVLAAINTRWRRGEIQYVLEKVTPNHLLADDEHLDEARAATADDVIALDDFLSRLQDVPPAYDAPDLEADDLISLIFTSGTTGFPKAVQQTHGNFVMTGQAYPTWLGLEPGDRLYTFMPLYHLNSQAYLTMTTLALHGTMILVEKFSASRFWDDVRKYRVNTFSGIPAVLLILLKLPPGPHEREHEVRMVYGYLDPEPRREFEERLGVRTISGFGMSECTFGAMWPRTGKPAPLTSIGKPRRHPHPEFVNEMKVVDDDGQEVPQGELGELIVRNPGLAHGYFNDPELTDAAFKDGWLYSGDIGKVDADGFFFFLDGKKDVLRKKGENISSIEVEAVIGAHPSVEEAALVGIPAELGEDELVAFVKCLDGKTVEPRELTDLVASKLADFKVPRFVQFVDSFPMTGSGKIQKAVLRDSWVDEASWWDREAADLRR